MTPTQREHFDEAVAFVIEKLGCGPEVRTILDRIRELDQRNRELERQVDELQLELFLEQISDE